MSRKKIKVKIYESCPCDPYHSDCYRCGGKGWIEKEQEVEIKSGDIYGNSFEKKIEKARDMLDEIEQQRKENLERRKKYE